MLICGLGFLSSWKIHLQSSFSQKKNRFLAKITRYWVKLMMQKNNVEKQKRVKYGTLKSNIKSIFIKMCLQHGFK
jgi:hypothetical protein